MTKEQALSQIEKELATANHAQNIGNAGMVRVCARRAVGVAISFWLQLHPKEGWGNDVMHKLRSLQIDQTMPQDVRDAAERLITKITEQFSSPFTTNPTDDANIIVNHLMPPFISPPPNQH